MRSRKVAGVVLAGLLTTSAALTTDSEPTPRVAAVSQKPSTKEINSRKPQQIARAEMNMYTELARLEEQKRVEEFLAAVAAEEQRKVGEYLAAVAAEEQRQAEERARAEQSRNVPPPPTRNDAPAVPAGSTWDALAQCESGGDWHINTGNGFTGGLQFMDSTWLGSGGGEYAPSAYLATREQQIEIAERTLAGSSYAQQWPQCSAELGLR